jgi:hypothetical protein
MQHYKVRQTFCVYSSAAYLFSFLSVESRVVRHSQSRPGDGNRSDPYIKSVVRRWCTARTRTRTRTGGAPRRRKSVGAAWHLQHALPPTYPVASSGLRIFCIIDIAPLRTLSVRGQGAGCAGGGWRRRRRRRRRAGANF